MTSTAARTTGSFPYLALFVLTGAIFVSVTSEFLPTGLLPQMAAELGVSESRIGLLVTVFAGTVVVSTAPLTVVTRRYPRKPLVVLLLLVFAVSNVIAAFAPNYEVLLASRVLGGLAHGLFWACVGPYAARLVEPRQLAKAVSITNGGGTVAFVLGVPVGTALGIALGWRTAFLATAVAIVVLTVLVARLLPPVQHIERVRTGEIALPFHRDRTAGSVLVVCLIVVIVMTGQNIYYTYIAPWLIEVGGFPEGAVSGLLFAYGAAGAVGLVLAGTLGDRFPRATPTVMLVGVAASVAAIALLADSPVGVVVALVLWSVCFGGLPSLMHARLLRAASPRIRDLASASLTTAFNAAIGGGALLGGIAFDALGVAALPWIQVAVTAAGVLFVVVSDATRPGIRAPRR